MPGGYLRNYCVKTQMCRFHQVGGCLKGRKCIFAHSLEELRPPPDLRFTKLCPQLINSGSCGNPACRFAHSREQLRRIAPLPGAGKGRSARKARNPAAPLVAEGPEISPVSVSTVDSESALDFASSFGDGDQHPSAFEGKLLALGPDLIPPPPPPFAPSAFPEKLAPPVPMPMPKFGPPARAANPAPKPWEADCSPISKNSAASEGVYGRLDGVPWPGGGPEEMWRVAMGATASQYDDDGELDLGGSNFDRAISCFATGMGGRDEGVAFADTDFTRAVSCPDAGADAGGHGSLDAALEAFKRWEMTNSEAFTLSVNVKNTFIEVAQPAPGAGGHRAAGPRALSQPPAVDCKPAAAPVSYFSEQPALAGISSPDDDDSRSKAEDDELDVPLANPYRRRSSRCKTWSGSVVPDLTCFGRRSSRPMVASVMGNDDGIAAMALPNLQ